MSTELMLPQSGAGNSYVTMSVCVCSTGRHIHSDWAHPIQRLTDEQLQYKWQRQGQHVIYLRWVHWGSQGGKMWRPKCQLQVRCTTNCSSASCDCVSHSVPSVIMDGAGLTGHTTHTTGQWSVRPVVGSTTFN